MKDPHGKKNHQINPELKHLKEHERDVSHRSEIHKPESQNKPVQSNNISELTKSLMPWAPMKNKVIQLQKQRIRKSTRK